MLDQGPNVNEVVGGLQPLTSVILCDQPKLSPSVKSTKLIEADAYSKASREIVVKWLIAAGANVNVNYSMDGDFKSQRPIVKLARKKGLKHIGRELNNADSRRPSTYRRYTWR